MMNKMVMNWSGLPLPEHQDSVKKLPHSCQGPNPPGRTEACGVQGFPVSVAQYTSERQEDRKTDEESRIES